MRLLLIRHGDPDYVNDSLTETGFHEAEYLAERIARLNVAEYYVSPLGRAMDTAAPTLRKAGRRAVICDWLQEFSIPIRRPDKHGEMSRVPWDWLPQDWLRDPQLLDPTIWCRNSVLQESNVGKEYDRVIMEFDSLLAKHGYVRDGLNYRVENANSDTLVFFSHFGLCCVLLSHLMNCSPVILWHGICMAPTSVTTIYTEERRAGIASFRAQSIGDISHLYAKGAEPSFAARFCEVHGNGDRID